ncbi:MAG: allantoinase AllB [Ferruginibacter sp.]
MFGIHSTRIIIDNAFVNATIIIDNGKIAAIKSGAIDELGLFIIEAGDDILMAGVIDTHVHINEPGRMNWEGFDTATKAALAGGITSLVEMPLNASPVTTTLYAFEQKLAATEGKLHTNIGFWGGVIPGNEKEIMQLATAGVLGFKAFLTHSGIDEFPNVTEADLDKAMPLIAAAGLPLLVHCELDGPSISGLNSNPTSYSAYLLSRPRKWEDDAIAMMIRLCRKHNCRTHIVHLSSADSLPQILQAKKEGLLLTVETGQHYLYFNAEGIADGHTEFKCAPPIREKENNEKLWEALSSGLIDFVATDHSPAPPAMKKIKTGNFMEAWGGIASLQFALPALWTAAKKRNINPVRMAQWLCEQPAKLAGLQQTKGRIKVGYDADLVVWNPDEAFKVEGKNILHRHPITPYLNEMLFGRVKQTYLSGTKVFDAGNILHLNQGKIILHD